MSNQPSIQKVEAELNKELMTLFKGERTSYIQVGEEKWFLPIKYEKSALEFLNLEVRSDDTWIVTFPRSGTNLTCELIWLLANNIDFDAAKKTPLIERVQFLSLNILIHDEIYQEIWKENNSEGQKFIEAMNATGWERVKSAPSPRFIRTHLPFQLLPQNLLTSGAKLCYRLNNIIVFYVARNPKDVAVSYYHLNRHLSIYGYVDDFEKFWNYFERNLLLWTPYWAHVNGGWSNRNNPNVQFIFYEELNKNLPDVILRLAKFLSRKLTDDQVNALVDHLSFDNFKKNDSVNLKVLEEYKIAMKNTASFIRNGKVGGWVDEFTPELSDRADKWIAENLKKTDLKFPL